MREIDTDRVLGSRGRDCALRAGGILQQPLGQLPGIVLALGRAHSRARRERLGRSKSRLVRELLQLGAFAGEIRIVEGRPRRGENDGQTQPEYGEHVARTIVRKADHVAS